MNKDKRIIGRIIKRFKINPKDVCNVCNVDCGRYSTHIVCKCFTRRIEFVYIKLKRPRESKWKIDFLESRYYKGNYRKTQTLENGVKQGISESSNGTLLYFWLNKILK